MALLTNLISYWRMEGNSNDSLGTNNGTDTNMTYGVAGGKIEQGATYGGTSKIVLKTSKIIASLTNSSVSMWVKTTQAVAGSGYPLYCERGSSGNDIFKICVGSTTANTGKIFIVHRDDAGTLDNNFIPTAARVDDGNWHFVVMTKAGVAAKLYIDNVLSSSGNISGNDTMTDATLQVWSGLDQGDALINFVGSIDEMGVWSKTLSVIEIGELYRAGYGRTFPLDVPDFGNRFINGGVVTRPRAFGPGLAR